MKIVDLQTFLSLPEGTVYSRYQPCIFTGLEVKASAPGDMDHDWCYDDLIIPIDADDSGDFSAKCSIAEAGVSVALDFYNSTSRDGMFDDEALFAVMEPDEVRALIAKLEKSLPDCYPQKQLGPAPL